MTWWSAVDEIALVVAWLWFPGLAFLHAVGARGLIAWLIAPAASLGGLASWAVAFGALGVPWNRVTVLAACGVTIAAVGGVRVLGARLRLRYSGSTRHARTTPATLRELLFPAQPHDRAAQTGAGRIAVVGVVVGGLLGAVPVILGMGSPDRVPQAHDSVMHLNAIQFILDTADASSLHVGRLAAQVGDPGFYPAAWHGVVALSTTNSVVVASHAMVVVMVGLIWPAALAAAALATASSRRIVAFFAPVMGAAAVAFPSQLLSWGPLWPNALSLALVPGALAATAMTLRVGGRRAAWAIATLTCLLGVALAHPTGLLTYAMVATPLLIAHAARAVAGARHETARGRWMPIAFGTVGVTAWLATWGFVLHIMNGALATRPRGWHTGFWPGVWQALTDTVLDTDWPAAALLEIPRFPGSRLIGGLTLLGAAYLVFVRRDSRWLVGSLAVLLAFAGLSDDSRLFGWTDAWFSDIFRLRAAVPVASALVMAHALDAVTTCVASVLARLRHKKSTSTMYTVTAATAVAVALIGVTNGLRAPLREQVVHNRYVTLAVEGRGARTTAAEQAMMERLRDELSPDGVLLGNPPSGASLVLALAHIPVLFPVDDGRWSEDALLVGASFDQIHTDERVCDALGRLGVRYFYADADVATPEGRGVGAFSGIPAEAPQPGFELVDAGGTARVYRITACD